MKKKKTWILVADGALARVYQTDAGTEELAAVRGGEFAAENLPARDIDADKPGQGFDRAGQGQRRMRPQTDSRRHAKVEFAQELANYLQNAQQRRAYDDLVIVAPAKTLGDLRAALTPAVRDLVKAELSKDLVHLREQDLPQHLDRVLSP